MGIRNWAVLIFLGANAVKDIRKREILLWTTILFLIVGLVLSFRLKTSVLISMVFSLLPGLLLLAFGKVTKEAVGYGDGLVLLAVGSYLGVRQTLESIWLASLTAAVAAGIIWCRKRDRNQRLPFVPFLFLGYFWSCL